MGLDRKALRDALHTTFTNAFGTSVALITKSLPRKLSGVSPVITMEDGPSRPAPYGTPTEPSVIGITFGVWVRADDSETAEDLLDDLVDKLVDTLMMEYNAEWLRETTPSYEIDDGVVYRVEWHDVAIQW